MTAQDCPRRFFVRHGRGGSKAISQIKKSNSKLKIDRGLDAVVICEKHSEPQACFRDLNFLGKLSARRLKGLIDTLIVIF
jgi:hypothetical protein